MACQVPILRLEREISEKQYSNSEACGGKGFGIEYGIHPTCCPARTFSMKRSNKLIVMIPCFNEEKTLPDVLKSIPKKIPGVTKIETLVVDDGSTDKTVRMAKKYKVKHFVIHRHNQGLAKSFADGLDGALAAGADIIVNTDGDNQYPQEDIPRLIQPIMEGTADMVVADRQTDNIKHFSFGKKILQKVGSAVVRAFSGTNVPDVVSGFRAYSREAALRLNIFTDYSYTIETIIQAGKKNLFIQSVKIKTKPKTRNSRLIKNLWFYLKASAATALRLFAIYEPLKVFGYIAFFTALPGIVLILRFIYVYASGDVGTGHIQSLIIASIFILVGFQIGLIGIVADLISINRKKTENILYRIKKMELEKK